MLTFFFDVLTLNFKVFQFYTIDIVAMNDDATLILYNAYDMEIKSAD